MKVTLGKGTEEFMFFADFFKLVSNFYVPDNTENYFKDLIAASDEVLRKYEQCDFYQFAKVLVLAFNVYVSDVKFKGKKSGHWTITFRED